MEVTESVDVLLFKSIHEINDTNNDPYFKKLKEAHVSVELIQPLQYSYKNLDDLTDALATPHILSGIIFVSPRSVFAVINCLHRLKQSIIGEWNSKEIFVVGETTGLIVADKLKLKHKGSSSGSLNSLINDFISADKYDKPLLMPCGNLHDRNDENILKSNNISVKYIEVYDTGQCDDLECRLKDLFSFEKEPKILVFFSPSGVRAVLPHIPNLYERKFSIVALGPKTKSALIEAGVEVTKTCLKPTVDDLYEAVTSLLSEQTR